MPILTDRIREAASQHYVQPAARRGISRLAIKVKELQARLFQDGFPVGRTPMICSALKGKKFLLENHLELERVEGPPSGQSTTMVYHYRIVPMNAVSLLKPEITPENDPLLELRGIFKGAIREGAPAFLRELRKDKKKASAAA